MQVGHISIQVDLLFYSPEQRNEPFAQEEDKYGEKVELAPPYKSVSIGLRKILVTT